MSLRPTPYPRKSHVPPGPERNRLRRLHVVVANGYFDREPLYRDNVERPRRLFVMAVAAALGTVVGATLLVSLFASGALPWLVGAVLVVAASGVVVLGLHAGGHGWFVPMPVLVLAGAWAFTVSAGSWASATAWALAALALSSAALAAVFVLPALAYRHAPGPGRGTEPLVGASGTTLSPLTPRGIARVKNETWTAESLSGPLPSGAPVHVVRVDGLRLLVWSEAGAVPGHEALGSTNKEKEEP
jgi:membrane-bound ClpP family serine protease